MCLHRKHCQIWYSFMNKKSISLPRAQRLMRYHIMKVPWLPPRVRQQVNNNPLFVWAMALQLDGIPEIGAYMKSVVVVVVYHVTIVAIGHGLLKKFWPCFLVLGCVLRTAGNSIIWNYADPLTSLELLNYVNWLSALLNVSIPYISQKSCQIKVANTSWTHSTWHGYVLYVQEVVTRFI